MSRRLRRALGLLLISTFAAPAPAAPSFSGAASHGMPGLLETPWAYAPPDGTLSLSISSALPYVYLATSAQVLPWFWFGARYTQVRDRLYQPDSTNDTPYLDKGFDLVFSPLTEGRYTPAVSIGLLDIAGTGIFGSEYIAASKSWWGFSATLGLGWGRLGSAGDLQNPLSEISPRFDEERDVFDPDEDQGGALFSDNWFSGPETAVFGSLAWHSPARRWQAFVEYDGNIYDNGNTNLQRDNEPASRRVASATRWNAGVRWRPWRGTELTAGYIRGNTATVSIRLFGDLDANPLRTTPPALSSRIQRRSTQEEATSWVDSLWSENLWLVRKTSTGPAHNSARIDAVFGRTGHFIADSLSIARIAFQGLPEVDTLETRDIRVGMPRLQATWKRADVAAEEAGSLSRGELIESAQISQASPCPGVLCSSGDLGEVEHYLKYPAWAYTVGPSLRSNIGSAGGFWLTDFQLKPGVRLQLSGDLSLSSVAALRVAGTLDEVTSTDSSALPPVRSNLEQYQTESGFAYLESLEAEYFQKLSQRLYAKVNVGILEEMFGGVFGELAWVPSERRLALGLELAWAQQRDFNQLFGFQGYGVLTGHASIHWNTGWHGVRTELSVGRYLARDTGATLKVSRQFNSGLEVGAFATRTNVSAEDFGEGSFDKGFFFNLPLDTLMGTRSKDTIRFEYRFLTRDGGQKLQVNRRLLPELDFPATP